MKTAVFLRDGTDRETAGRDGPGRSLIALLFLWPERIGGLVGPHDSRGPGTKDRTAARNREHVSRFSLLKRHAAQRVARIDRRIAAIEVELKASLSREPDLSARYNVLVSILGSGEITAIAMLIGMPELTMLRSSGCAKCGFKGQVDEADVQSSFIGQPRTFSLGYLFREASHG